MESRLTQLRKAEKDMLFISFPGDEKTSGGCLAAGRGFFHINPHGGAEPCPFSPYSDTNLKTVPLEAAINSPLFTSLRESACLDAEHRGGCVLFEKKTEVERLVRKSV
jgi:MoaA/NifB/PqqE/SkfB family radical SAM enzyme